MALEDLPKRERAILELLYKLGEASARDIQKEFADDLSYSTVRTFLNNLEQRGKVSHRQSGLSFVYFPLAQAEQEGLSVLQQAQTTFFSGSKTKAIAALLGTDSKISEEEYRELKKLLDSARDNSTGKNHE